MNSLPSGTVTFLFTDIEGSTKLAQKYPEEWEDKRARHHTILRSAIELHNGYIFQIIGDAFCATFHTADDALQAAVESQKNLHNENWGNVIIRVRMGINTGKAEIQKSGEYQGYLAMSRVQRLMSAAHGGQTLLSSTTAHLTQDNLPKEITLCDLGERRLKDMPQPEHIFQLIIPNLPANFPPLRTLEASPNNLPTQLTSFIGREKELADVKILLENTHLLTLIGPGGTGKTRLLLQTSTDLLETFPHGAWLVELASILDPILVPRTTALAIGLREEPQRPVIDMLCDYLRDKKLLILLDNCEHLVDACAQMADRILHASPNVRILASSREALGIGGEVTYRVPSLGLPDLSHLPPAESLGQYEAVKLFIDRATSAVPTFKVTDENALALAQICFRLDGIPLAVELAAAKIRVLSVEQIARRLDDRFRLLTGGSRTALERHQTLRAAIDWSYNLLPTNEQVLFRKLSIFVNGWTLEAAEVVCSDEYMKNDDVLDLLEHLINKSLVTLDETRYRMLETIRQYANEKLVEAGESYALRDRHVEYFLNLAETAEPHLTRPEQMEWLAQLDADYENLRSALEWALNKESAELSLRMCAALGWFWYIRGYWLEGTKWLQNALSKPSQQSYGENIARVKALYQDAALANYLDDLEHLKNSAERSLALAQEVSDKRDIAIARFYVGWALDRQGDDDSALPMMEQSLIEFQKIGELYWESVTYRWLSLILVKRGDLRIEERVHHHLKLARKAGERNNLASALLNLAMQLFEFNYLQQAEEYAEEADDLFNQIGSTFSESGFFIARLAWFRGNFIKAREVLMNIEERSRLIGDRNLQSMANADLGCLALEEGDLEHAYLYLEESLTTAREIRNKDSIVWRLAELGNTFYLQGNMEKFKQSYRESFSLGKELGIRAQSSLLLLVLDSISSHSPEEIAHILGAIAYPAKPTHPLWKRPYDRAEVHIRQVLGNEAFDSAFAEGQKITLNEALNLALTIIEEM
jgi:predicted ATPase/class 3 adenylate cyclase